ncbi:MAG: hypothetical protein LBD70_01425 [Bifidobacteriaceae bacterium]|nr:hypothetical protein [Bifidobacteriaceae bacterium]
MADEPKRVLHVAWSFPPAQGSGGADALDLANASARRGHDVTVLTAGTDAFDLVVGADADRVGQIDPKVAVVRVDNPLGVRDPIVNRWPDWRRRYGWDHAEWREAISRAIFPEPTGDSWRPAWLAPATAAARALAEAKPFDLAIATVLPAVGAGVALSLNAATGLPFVVYECEPWSFEPPAGESQAPRGLTIFEQCFARAIQVWCPDAARAAARRREFPSWGDKIRAVGFDREAPDAAFGPLEEQLGW